ncbi:MAG: hypothetical protein HYU86_06870 [Chloroflexi bacterium]|nr:hypothetical protein [Chloroflexota bacterium]
MKITFPHFGHTGVALETLFSKYGVECIVPPQSNKRTLSLGVKYSPEGICLPYKVLLGNMIEGLELGADTVIDVGGPGLCRLGYYAKLHESVLRNMGFDFQMLVFDWQEQGIISLARFIRDLIAPHTPWRQVIADIRFGLFGQLVLMDELEKRVHWVRAREVDKGAASAIWRTAPGRVAAARDAASLKKVRQDLFAELDALPRNDEARPLKVALLGEFFVAIDPFSNMDLEEELGKRGVEVNRAAYLMNWAKAWLFLEAVGLGHGHKVKRAANPYLKRDVSGDAMQSVGEIILHHKEDYDGIVHVLPFTCLPEIVAQNVFPKVTHDYQIPVLSLIFDEQMGRAGFLTRIEAFVDLMERRRWQRAS